jgi:hypothetical protein
LCNLCLSLCLCIQQSLLCQSHIFWGSSAHLKGCCWVSDLYEQSSIRSHSEDKEAHELFPKWCWRVFSSSNACLALDLVWFSLPFKRTVLVAITNKLLLKQDTIYQACKILEIWFRNQPNINESKLLFCMYSQSTIISFPFMQYPRNPTIFMCWSFAITNTSFLNAFMPSCEIIESLFTAISSPPGNVPWDQSYHTQDVTTN